MNRMLTVLALLAAIGSAAAAQTVEWTYDLDEGGNAPTLYPDAEHPTGVLINAVSNVVRLDGQGKVLWEYPVEPPAASPVTVADLDADGSYELLFTTQNGAIHCITDDARPLWSHTYNVDVGAFKSVVAADVHPSEGLEVLFGFNDGWLHCLSASGETLWTFFGDRFRVGSLAVGDADADGAPEIVYGTDNGHVYCLSGYGEAEWRFNELAPYGRSGINLADLDADGVPEVVFTRSNVNNNTCMVAISGKDGSLLWRTKDFMQGYVSNAVVDFEGDGRLEVLHGDKGNNLYAENADGSRRWQAALNAHGLFWAPAVADVDGDGQLEAIAGLRGKDPESGACAYLVGADGAIKAKLALGGGANAGPAVGDIDGDGELEVIFTLQKPEQVKCVTWHAGGRVAWPSLRGDSCMTATRPNVPRGVPERAAMRESGGQDVAVSHEQVLWGENRWRLSWSTPVPENSFIEVAVTGKDGQRRAAVVDLKPGVTEAEVPWLLTQPGKSTVSVRLLSPGHGQPVFAAWRSVKPLAPEYCGIKAVEAACKDAIMAGEAADADTSGIAVRLTMLVAERTKVAQLAKSGAPNASVAAAATALHEQSGDLLAMAEALGRFWEEGGTGDFVFWEDSNPWDRFDPTHIPETFDMASPLRFAAYKNEFENKAITIFNTTSDAIDVRCVFKEPSLGQGWYAAEEPMAANVTLLRQVPVLGERTGRVFDALPELDLSRSITIPAGQARQLWLVAKTHDLEPGTHNLTLYLGLLGKREPVFREVPIEIEVWPIALPTDVYAKMNWTRLDRDRTSDQDIQSMIDHGMSVVYGPSMPAVPVDARGRLAGKVDWTAFDAVLDRAPKHWTFLWGAPPSRRWPKGVKPDAESPEYSAGFKTALDQLVKHMKAKGFDYYQWAFYPIDEPWNTGFTHIPHLKHFCEMVKKADPKAQVYADPAGLVRVEYLDEFKDLIDIWQPELNTLKRDPKLVDWFQENAARFWYYEAPGPAKDWDPLAHYRAYGWFAVKYGTEGGGYWVYKACDVWWPIESTDYSAVYQTNTDVVTSRRWEADRDGIEDYRAVHVLKDEIAKARAAGHVAEAARAEALIDEAVEALIGWQSRNIDEITRVTRDYDMSFDLLMDYRLKIRDEILRLRGL